MDVTLPAPSTLYGAFAVGASAFGALGVYHGTQIRRKNFQVMDQLKREKRRSEQLAQFVIPIGASLAAETHLETLLEKILLEGKSLAQADGGTLYLVTPEKTLRFAMLINDSLKIAMGGSSGQPVSLPSLHLYDPATGMPNLKNIATSCALEAKLLSVGDAHGTQGFDFSGTKAFDQRMNYRTISVLCVPLKDTHEQVIGVLQLINAQEPRTRRVIPFDDHLAQMIGLLGLLAAAALKSYLRVQTLTRQVEELQIQIDEAKKERQVAEIAGSDYFKDLQARAREMRCRVSSPARK
jgi:GAF domain-containing protein